MLDTLRRHGFKLAVASSIVGFGIVGALKLHAYDERTAADGKARDAAIKAYAAQLTADTQGAIRIKLMRGSDDYANNYAWNGNNHTLGVKVVLGTCSRVDGAFRNVPDRPNGPAALGVLHLDLPGVNRTAAHAMVAVTAPNFQDQLAASGLAHCVAGDKRFQPKQAN